MPTPIREEGPFGLRATYSHTNSSIKYTAGEDVVPWEEVLLNDKLRTRMDDAEMRAEIEALRTRLAEEREARTQLFRRRRNADGDRVYRRMCLLCMRSAFREWASVAEESREGRRAAGRMEQSLDSVDPSLSMHLAGAEGSLLLSDRSNVLLAELHSLVAELWKDEGNIESSLEKRMVVAGLRQQLTGLLKVYSLDGGASGDSNLGEGDTVISEERAWLEGFRAACGGVHSLVTTASAKEEEAARAQLLSWDPSSALAQGACSAILSLKHHAKASWRAGAPPSHKARAPKSLSPNKHRPRKSSKHKSRSASREGARAVAKKEIARLELEGRGLFLDVCTLEDSNSRLCAGLSEALSELEMLGRRKERLEELLALGKPLKARDGRHELGDEELRRLFDEWEGEEGLPNLSSSSSDGESSEDEGAREGGRGSPRAYIKKGKGSSPRKRAKHGGDARLDAANSRSATLREYSRMRGPASAGRAQRQMPRQHARHTRHEQQEQQQQGSRETSPVYEFRVAAMRERDAKLEAPPVVFGGSHGKGGVQVRGHDENNSSVNTINNSTAYGGGHSITINNSTGGAYRGHSIHTTNNTYDSTAGAYEGGHSVNTINNNLSNVNAVTNSTGGDGHNSVNTTGSSGSSKTYLTGRVYDSSGWHLDESVQSKGFTVNTHYAPSASAVVQAVAVGGAHVVSGGGAVRTQEVRREEVVSVQEVRREAEFVSVRGGGAQGQLHRQVQAVSAGQQQQQQDQQQQQQQQQQQKHHEEHTSSWHVSLHEGGPQTFQVVHNGSWAGQLGEERTPVPFPIQIVPVSAAKERREEAPPAWGGAEQAVGAQEPTYGLHSTPTHGSHSRQDLFSRSAVRAAPPPPIFVASYGGKTEVHERHEMGADAALVEMGSRIDARIDRGALVESSGVVLSTEGSMTGGSMDAGLVHDHLLSPHSFDGDSSQGEAWLVSTSAAELERSRHALLRAEREVRPTLSSTPRGADSDQEQSPVAGGGEEEEAKVDLSWLTSMKSQFEAAKSKAAKLRDLT